MYATFMFSMPVGEKSSKFLLLLMTHSFVITSHDYLYGFSSFCRILLQFSSFVQKITSFFFIDFMMDTKRVGIGSDDVSVRLCFSPRSHELSIFL